MIAAILRVVVAGCTDAHFGAPPELTDRYEQGVLEEAAVGAVLLGDFKRLREGDTVKRTGKVMSLPVGPAMIGRVVNPLGLEGQIISGTTGAEIGGKFRISNMGPDAEPQPAPNSDV